MCLDVIYVSKKNELYLWLKECFPREIHAAYIIKPEKFWEKQKTSVGSSKYKFEVIMRNTGN